MLSGSAREDRREKLERGLDLVNKEILTKRILVAGKKIPADLVVRNGQILNVFTGRMMEGDIAVVDGYFAGIGSYEGKEIIDAKGKVIVPGFIDGHIHIESTMLTPREISKVLLKHGVTTVITDPHEIANVAGSVGIEFMLEDAEQTPMDIYVNLPSSVPATPFENNGAELKASDLEQFLDHPKVLGLAEVMDFPSVAGCEETMIDKIAASHAGGGLIDGHAAGLNREELNVYMAAGIRNDHESISSEEGRDRLDMGMYLMVREGTVAKDLNALLPVITPENSRRCLFVTDDMLLDDLIREGDVDHAVRLAIQKGLNPVTAVQMATLNTSECFGLRHLGAIAAGYQADFLMLDDLHSVSIHKVFKKGKCVVADGKIDETFFPDAAERNYSALPDIQVKDFTPDELDLQLSSSFCNVIGITPDRITTVHLKEEVTVRDGSFIPSVEKDQLLMAVIERHKKTGNIGKGIVKGFELTSGAIATSVAHDSHNIVAVGTSAQDMYAAVEEVIRMNGGMCVVDQKNVKASLPLNVGGLMSDLPYEKVHEKLQELYGAARQIGASKAFNPFLMLSFLTLPVIPALKLTDQGLFDFSRFTHIAVETD